jgi:hypothetical protein
VVLAAFHLGRGLNKRQRLAPGSVVNRQLALACFLLWSASRASIVLSRARSTIFS